MLAKDWWNSTKNVSSTFKPSRKKLYSQDDLFAVESLQCYLDQIDQIEDNISKLEHAAYKLDAYTVRLENKYKALTSEKR